MICVDVVRFGTVDKGGSDSSQILSGNMMSTKLL